MKVVSRLAALCAVMVVASSGAWAQWHVTYADSGIGLSGFTISDGYGHEVGGVIATLFKGTYLDSFPPAYMPSGGPFYAFCVDTETAFQFPQTGDVKDWSAPPPGAQADTNWGTIAAIAENYIPFGSPSSVTEEDKYDVALAQLAIWQLLHPSAYVVSGPTSSYLNGKSWSKAVDDFIAHAPTSVTDKQARFYEWTTRNGSGAKTCQDTIVVGSNVGIGTNVPEASSLLLLLPGLLPLGLLARKRSKA
jgi:hypothetical protein